jgi:hypothetical protein
MIFVKKWFRSFVFDCDQNSGKTIHRLLCSVHVADLRWIASVPIVIIFISLIAVIEVIFMPGLDVKFLDYAELLKVSAVLAAAGGVVGWCYRTGNNRLGIVDIFACEITTLCRICTINGLADTCIGALELAMIADPSADYDQIIKMRGNFSHFDSSETYTPVFDGSALELQVLNGKVLMNITAFYTYWKATRDAFRKLDRTQLKTIGHPVAAERELWLREMCNVIYMQFLACESARKAVHCLIEYGPGKAENTIVILLSELPAYRFLLKFFPEEDVRHRRLQLREISYSFIVGEVYYYTVDEHRKYQDEVTVTGLARGRLSELRRDWEEAHCLLNELKSRYENSIGQFPSRESLTALSRAQGLYGHPGNCERFRI